MRTRNYPRSGISALHWISTDVSTFIFNVRMNRRTIAMIFICQSLCPSATGVHCDHMVHVSADLSLWLCSGHPDTKGRQFRTLDERTMLFTEFTDLYFVVFRWNMFCHFCAKVLVFIILACCLCWRKQLRFSFQKASLRYSLSWF